MSGAVLGAPARPPIEVENLRVGFGSAIHDDRNNLCKVGTWTPVWVQLRAGDERFTGAMEVVVADDDGTPTTVRQTINLAAGESQRVVAYTRPGTIDPAFDIRVIDLSRKHRTVRVEGASLLKGLNAIPANNTLILTLGKPQGVEAITELPGFRADNLPGTRDLVVARIDVTGGLMPGRWYGYDAARAVVLDTNDREVMAALDNLRGRALVDWVSRGGHLVVSVGQNWQQLRDSAIGAILPALPNGQEQVNDLAALESFVGGVTKPINKPDSASVQITKLEQVESRGGKVLSAAVGTPLVVRGTYGFGRVTAVALDVDQRPFADWADRPRFWVKALDLAQLSAENVVGPGVVGGRGRIIQTGVSDLSTRLRQALEQFPGVKLVSFGWVAFFIFIYILLIGPGDYFFLKKVLKRMELTWVTFPLIVITVSALAYYGSYLVKGTALRINKVDIVDVLQGPGPENAVPAGGVVRGSTFFDVFSPRNHDYTLSIVPSPMDRDVAPNAASSSKPSAGSEVLMTWFGVPETGIGGMGNRGQMSFFGGGYTYEPPGGAETLEGLRVPIWSTKSLTARWFGPGPARPLIESDIQAIGPDRLEGTIANRSGVALEDAILIFKHKLYELGTVSPNATLRVELSRDRQLSGLLKERVKNFLAEDYRMYDASLPIDRADLLRAIMFHDATATSTTSTTVASDPLHSLDLTGMLALERPMLVAKVSRPGSTLVMSDAPSAPQIDQMTILRVVLPLKADSRSSGKP
jgi:hypothetical protein